MTTDFHTGARAFAAASCLAVLFAMASPAQAVPVLDQSVVPSTSTLTAQGILAPSVFDLDTAQTFTAGLTGTLTEVQVFVKVEGGPSATLDWDLRPLLTGGSPSNDDGSALASGTVTITNTGYQFISFDLTSFGFSITSGDELAIVLSTSTGQAAWGGTTGYADGASFQRASVFTNFDWIVTQPDTDQGFKTFVEVSETGGGEVPEPATLALFGLGLAGMGWMRRRRR